MLLKPSKSSRHSPSPVDRTGIMPTREESEINTKHFLEIIKSRKPPIGSLSNSDVGSPICGPADRNIISRRIIPIGGFLNLIISHKWGVVYLEYKDGKLKPDPLEELKDIKYQARAHFNKCKLGLIECNCEIASILRGMELGIEPSRTMQLLQAGVEI